MLHFHHIIEDELIRVYQAQTLIKWVEINTKIEDFTVIVGDFNATPDSITYKLFIDSGYESLHLKFYGTEPEKTFHNKMDAPFKDTDPEGTFDYIL